MNDAPVALATASGEAMLGYIEDMLLQLAELASDIAEPALSASLTIAAIQAGARRKAPSGERA